MTVSEAVALHPEARWVISAYQFGGFGYCPVSSEESLTALADGYAVPVERLLRELNALLQRRE